jgi:Uma2 family endonuclease
MALVKDAAATRPRRVVYPVRDGKPMAETDKHAAVMTYVREALRLFFQDRTDSVYVSGNNFVYWREGDPKARISPDVYVVFGVPMRLRDSYKAWEERGRLPAFVLEVTSKKTQAEDNGPKFRLYEQVLRVQEHVRFDPTGDYLMPHLQGFRLADGFYSPIPMEGGDRIFSEQLGLFLVMDGERLRLLDPTTSAFLPTLQEAEEKRKQAEERQDAAEQEVERLRAELDALRRSSGG